ncbi:MAG: hypothetical protein U0271_24425 [Polyangiaceae bacterium]
MRERQLRDGLRLLSSSSDHGRPLFAALAIAGAAFASCADERIDTAPIPEPEPAEPQALPPEFCDPVDVTSPRAFPPCSRGSGDFGRWFVDEAGLPAYEYMIDQATDDRALYFNTENLALRTHWGAFGNYRVNAMFSNDGLLELVTQDRGIDYLNKVDDTQGWFGGGFSYVDDGVEPFATAYRYRPAGAATRRIFGAGYAEARTRYRDLRVTHRFYAPWGDAPYVVDEVSIENLTDEARSVAHYEVFDVARRNISTNWVVSGDPLTGVPATARAQRDALNARFDESVAYDADARALVVRRTHAANYDPQPIDDPATENDYPPDPFLVALVGDVSDTFTRKSTFFGDGSFELPAKVRDDAAGEGAESGPRDEVLNGLGQPRMLAMKTALDLAAGETKKLRFAYGYAPMGQPIEVDARLSNPDYDGLATVRHELDQRSFHFTSPAAPELHRELAWHATQIEASVGRRDYFEGHVVPQGSAYLYLHGADGAARDIGIFALPLTYFDTALAREELELYMRVQFFDSGRFTYAFQGHGVLDDAMGIHHAPSDLDLFFAWALGEYLGATGDVRFLDRSVPFYPRAAAPDATVRDHLVASLRHLFDTVGTGEHGLVRVGTGDWSDGIDFAAKDRALAESSGESVPNTQMAIAVLPRIADLLEPTDPALATEIRERVDAYRAALPSAWGGSFFGRAYFGDGVLYHATDVDLEAQVWALIGDTFASEADRDSTLDAIHSVLDVPSPAGATLTKDGQVWPAISGLLTEGYAKTRPDYAWDHFVRNTMVGHALAYPEVWFGIWSGPDGMNGPAGDQPGGTWRSIATPMTDFPVQNNNQHAMPLYAALRMAGIQATARGLDIDPRAPSPFSLETALVSVHRADGSIRVVYAPTGDSRRTVRIAAPAGEIITGLTLDGGPRDVTANATSIELDVVPSDGRAFEIAVTTAPAP